MPPDRSYSIMALWAHPRSMSTAIERIMRERGDLQCMHEPFMHYYYLELGRKHMPHSRLDPDRPTAFSDILKEIQGKARQSPVFFKDMAYYVVPEIFRYPALASEMRHLFLVRDPRQAILSYYRLDPGLLLEEVGIEAQWKLYQWLRENTDDPVPVIRAEAVQQDTEASLGYAWEQLGLPFCPSAFEWKRETVPDEWKTVAGWHGDVSASTGIRAATPTSEQLVTEEFEMEARRAPVLNELLEHHLPYYHRLVETSASPN